MDLLRFTAWRTLCTIRHGFLALLLASLISLEIPDTSVVRAQEVPGLYAPNQARTGNPSWVSFLTNPFASLLPEPLDAFPSGQPRGLSFLAEGLYMNFRGDSQVFSQTISTYLGGFSSAGDFQSVKPNHVEGFKVGLGYALEGCDARVLYSRYRAQPNSGQAPPRTATIFGGAGPYAATAPIVALNNFQADAGFTANLFDFQAGYSIRLGQFSTARLFGGVSYADAKNTLQGTGAVAGGGLLTVNRENVYRAWGPKIGLDLNCGLWRGFSLKGSGAVGGLFGTQKLTANNTFGSFNDSHHQNIVSLEGEAGIGYSFPTMEVTLGYRVERFSANNVSFVDVGASITSGSTVRTGNTSAVQYLEGGFLRFEVKL
jgi:hypothetical protein